jgi:6-phosphogluconate dehydrogenase (decarboxylating)
MLKLLLCLLAGSAIGTVLLELRQQHLNLSYQTNELHNRIQATQAQLWNQQMNIAIGTAPNAIAQTLMQQGTKMTNPTVSTLKRAWIEDPDAE